MWHERHSVVLLKHELRLRLSGFVVRIGHDDLEYVLARPLYPSRDTHTPEEWFTIEASHTLVIDEVLDTLQGCLRIDADERGERWIREATSSLWRDDGDR